MQRRTWLTASLVALVAAVSDGEATADSSTLPPDGLTDPAERYRVYAALRFGPPGRAVFWWMTGTRFGLIDNELIPFFDMHVGSLHLRENLDADRYLVRSISALYFTPLGESSLLTAWDNPVTRNLVPLSYPVPSITTTEYSLSRGVLVEPSLADARVERDHRFGDVRLGGGLCQLDELSRVRVWRGNATTPQKVHDLYTWSAPIEGWGQSVEPIAATVAFNDFNDWSPRFQMGAQAGTGIARCTGRKVLRLEDMPTVWLSHYSRLHAGTFDSVR